MKTTKSKVAKGNKNVEVESYADYLRRVGADYAESGSEFTAEDYTTAAKVIDKSRAALMEAWAHMVEQNGDAAVIKKVAAAIYSIDNRGER